MLLLPDKNGNTAVDIALDNQSPRCLELMLSKLATLSSVKCAHLVLERMEELILMDLKSFQTFLESCVFQTPQMKQITALKLKEESEMFVDVHYSCMIDTAFMEKYCIDDKKIEKEKKTIELVERGEIANTGLDELGKPLLKATEKEDFTDALKREGQGNNKELQKKPRMSSVVGEMKKRVEIKAIEIDSIFVGKKSQ